MASVILTALAQIALKAGMAQSPLNKSFALPRLATALDLLLNPFIFLGLFLYVISVGFWLVVLSRVEVSAAYPFVALGILLTSVFGRIFFGETFSAGKVIGTLLILAGVAVLARG